MYPLNVILIRFTETEAQFEVRRELDSVAAVVEADYPDIPATVAGLPLASPAKRLLLIYLKSADELNQLEQLNAAFPGHPILALLEAGQDATAVIQAMRAGASQVVLLPLVAEDLRAALHRLAQQYGQAPHEATVIAVSGVSEGCGATTIALNLAREIAQVYERPCILVEFAFQMGQLACYLNIEPRFTTHDLLSDIDRLDIEGVRRALTTVAKDCSVLVGPYEGIVPVAVAPQEVVRLLNYLRQLAGVVVIDMPYHFDAVYFEVLAQAQRLVLIADQKIPSLHALRLVLEAVAQKEIAASKFLVVNRYDPRNKAFGVKRLQELLGTKHLLTIANDYPQLVATANDGRALRDLAPTCRTLADIDRLAARVLGVEQPPPPQPSLFTRLLQPFSDWNKPKKPTRGI